MVEERILYNFNEWELNTGVWDNKLKELNSNHMIRRMR
jgi:hypothetical protein